jgi:hypothetical protein
MTRPEIIRLRHRGKRPRAPMHDIRRAAGRIAGSAEVRICRHAVGSTDPAIHLCLSARVQDPRHTEFGVRRAEALRERGKRADLVLLDGNPLTDARNLLAVRRTFKGGPPLHSADADPRSRLR